MEQTEMREIVAAELSQASLALNLSTKRSAVLVGGGHTARRQISLLSCIGQPGDGQGT